MVESRPCTPCPHTKQKTKHGTHSKAVQSAKQRPQHVAILTRRALKRNPQKTSQRTTQQSDEETSGENSPGSFGSAVTVYHCACDDKRRNTTAHGKQGKGFSLNTSPVKQILRKKWREGGSNECKQSSR
jgi:hypothetical protein